ncbi:MAG: hypothetical protein LBU51_02785 [Bacteroidales bacterium]|jgi:hypothetical protein|nr:hypothetical protein [Bacteroidales bacterium]
MKKTLFIVALCIVMVAIMISCKEEYSERYDTKTRIKRIWEKNESDTSWSYWFQYDTVTKQLQSIDNSDGGNFVFRYSIIDKQTDRISSIQHHNIDYLHSFDEEVLLTYDAAGFITKMEYKMDGITRKTLTMLRRGDHSVSTITELFDFDYYDSMNSVWNSKFYNFFMGDDQATKQTLCKKMTAKDNFLQVEAVTVPVYEYDKDGLPLNVVKTYKEVKIPLEEVSIISTYTYDKDSKNPFYGLPFLYQGINSLNRYNRLTEHTVTENKHDHDIIPDVDIIFIFYYDTYNKTHYPDRIMHRSSIENNRPVTTYFQYYPTSKK